MRKLFRNLTENTSFLGLVLVILFAVLLLVSFIYLPVIALFALQVCLVAVALSVIVLKIIVISDEDINEDIARLIKKKAKKCENVYIMGHKRPDFDSFGACMGVYTLCRKYNKNTKVIVSQDRFAIREIYDKFIFGGYESAFIDIFAAEQSITENDLIILCDTHSGRMVESNKAFASAGERIVIDHHRENEAAVENCQNMFVYPEYSSCCEIVTSAIMSTNIKPSPLVAEAMLAGIMVDTRNFGVNCDEHTFSAASFLCKCEADTIDARNLFKSSVELERAKAVAVENLEIYREGIAFSVCDSDHKNVYLACARVADEILAIKNIEASVLFCKNAGTVYISARSNGKIDVNDILKRVGGGGHITAAGAQLENMEIIEAEKLLKETVDKYLLEVENK